MKTARVAASAVYIDCPYCEEGIADPTTGSYQITADSYAAGLGRDVITCTACGKQSKMPKLARF